MRCCMGRGTFQVHPTPQLLSQSPELPSPPCPPLLPQVSYMILQRVSPVTHSIGNSVKRVVVIASSILVFRNPVTTQNLAGTALALAGVFAYSQVKKAGGKAKPKAA